MKKIERTETKIDYQCDHCDYKDSHEWTTERHMNQEHLCSHGTYVRELMHNSHESDRSFYISVECAKCRKTFKEIDIELSDLEYQSFVVDLTTIFERILLTRRP